MPWINMSVLADIFMTQQRVIMSMELRLERPFRTCQMIGSVQNAGRKRNFFIKNKAAHEKFHGGQRGFCQGGTAGMEYDARCAAAKTYLSRHTVIRAFPDVLRPKRKFSRRRSRRALHKTHEMPTRRAWQIRDNWCCSNTLIIPFTTRLYRPPRGTLQVSRL